ncbi:MAG: helix-turn-helix domain-containing protein [Nanoarchaeota archaeon]
MLKTTLMEIGLSEKESNFYLLIIKHEKITAGEISKISGESRTHVYDTLNKLLKKGLISYVIMNNIKYFKAVKPERILDYLKEKEDTIKKQKKEILKIIPEIEKLQKEFRKEDVKIEIFEGSEGIKAVMNDILNEGKDFVTFGASSKVKDYLPEFFIERYLRIRKKKNIKAKQLFTEVSGVLETPLSQNKKLPKEFATPTTTAIYSDKVTIWFWLEVPRVILIKNKDLASSYKNYFELLWNSIK